MFSNWARIIPLTGGAAPVHSHVWGSAGRGFPCSPPQCLSPQQGLMGSVLSTDPLFLPGSAPSQDVSCAGDMRTYEQVLAHWQRPPPRVSAQS